MSQRPAVGIIGLGLIGGSVAMAFRRAGFSVFGYDINPATVARAYADAVIANGDEPWQGWAKRVDWVVIATPLMHVVKWLEQWQAVVDRPQVVIDLSSVKGQILPTLSALPERFMPICLHPMAGRELTGYAAACPDLFLGHVCAVVPVPGRPPVPQPLLEEILGVLGLRAYPIDAKSHDRIAALVSHLPYLVSAALLLTAQAQGDDLPGWPGMVGPGFLDTSRVGSSNPALWDDILRANREAVRPVLERFSSVIEQWVEDLRQERPCTGLADAPNIRHAVKEEQPCS